MVTTEVSEDPSRYSVVETCESGEVTGFEYKPEQPRSNLVAGEMFLFSTDVLLDALDHLQDTLGELGDYGEDLIPHVLEHHTVVEHRHLGYWMDLGTVQSYWTAQQQLLDDAHARMRRHLEGAQLQQAQAPGTAQGGKRVALVIGNGAYAAGPLPTAANDAGLVAQTL